MENPLSPPRTLLLPGRVFEGLMSILAIVVCWLQGRWPLDTFHWTTSAALWSVAATLPLLGGFAIVVRFREGPLGRLIAILNQYVLPLFVGCSWIDLALVALLAGLGEEMLFRAVIQQSLAEHVGGATGVWVGLVVSAALFGAAHWVTPLYGLMAGLIGLYLAGLWLWTGNLLVPIGAHSLYDFLVLAYLVRKNDLGFRT